MTGTFCIETFADPQMLLRVIGLFAQRSIVPERLHVERTGDRLCIELKVTDIVEETLAIVAAKLEVMPLVTSVTTEMQRAGLERAA